MKFTVERLTLVKLLRQVGRKLVPKDLNPLVRIYACAARVFVETSEMTAGVEALVFADGSCRVHRANLLDYLAMYPSKKNLVSDYAPSATPPALFNVSPVTDAWLARSGTRRQSPPENLR